MFGNTLVLPHADGNITCTKINQDGYASEYLCKRTLDEVRVRIRHTKTKAVTGASPAPAKDRHNVEVVQTVYAAGETPEYQRKVYVVIEQLPSDVDVKFPDALADWLIASTDASLNSLMAWES